MTQEQITKGLTSQVELQTYAYLQFKRMVKAYTNVCRLNSITVSKQVFMEKLLSFVKEEFFKCQIEISRALNSPKVIFVKCSSLVELLVTGLKSINKFNWELNEVSLTLLEDIDFILSDTYNQKLKIIEMEKLIRKKDNKKIGVLPYTKYGYKYLNYIVLILNFIASVAHSRGKDKLSLLSVYQAIQIKKLLYFGQFDALLSFMLNLNFLTLLHHREMHNHCFTLVKHLLRVGEDWQHSIETEGEITPQDVLEIKNSFVVIDEKAWSKPTLEKYIIFDPEMKIIDMNSSLNMWLHVRLINLYRFLGDLLHSKVRISKFIRL